MYFIKYKWTDLLTTAFKFSDKLEMFCVLKYDHNNHKNV